MFCPTTAVCLYVRSPAPGDKKHKKYERQIAIPAIVHEN